VHVKSSGLPLRSEPVAGRKEVSQVLSLFLFEVLKEGLQQWDQGTEEGDHDVEHDSLEFALCEYTDVND